MSTAPLGSSSLSPRDLEIQQLLDRASTATKSSANKSQLNQIERAEDSPRASGDGVETPQSPSLAILGAKLDRALQSIRDLLFAGESTDDMRLRDMSLDEYLEAIREPRYVSASSLPSTQPPLTAPAKTPHTRPRLAALRSTKFPAATLRVGRGFFATPQVYARNAP